MAKRRRLGPAVIIEQEAEQGLTSGLESQTTPPIARVAGDAAMQATAQELADELIRARAEGRLVQDIFLDQVDEAHLNRDRLAVSTQDMAALEASIAARGQQMPIEVVDLGRDASPRYGLISGYRRLAALRALATRTPDQGQTIRAVLRQPQGAADAYLAMVEENELRVGLSYYERAQVAARAADLGVFDGTVEAVQSLFSTASKAKRSKINAFIRLFRMLDPVLSFPEALNERLGLRLAQALDAGHGPKLYAGLEAAGPFADAPSQMARIEKLLASVAGSKVPVRPTTSILPGGLQLSQSRGSVKVSGAGVDAALIRDLEAWLTARQAGQQDRS